MNWEHNTLGVRIVRRVEKILSAELRDYLPLTLRQIHYKLVKDNVPGYANTQNKYKQLSAWLYEARVDGIISWDALIDRERIFSDLSGYTDSENYLRSYLTAIEQRYKRNLMQTQDERIEIWTEKNGMVSVLASFAEPYRVSVQSCKGFGSGSQFDDAVCRNDDKPLRLLYFGDHDPSGLWMSEKDIGPRLAEKHGLSVELERIALNIGQVQEYDLDEDWQPPKPKDTRSQWYIENYGRQCWELDALPPEVLGDLVTTAIESRVDMDLVREEQEREDAELPPILNHVERWRAISDLT